MKSLRNRILPFLSPLLLCGCFGSGEKSTVERQYHSSGEEWYFPCLRYKNDPEDEQNRCRYSIEEGRVKFDFVFATKGNKEFIIRETLVEDLEVDGIKLDETERLIGQDGRIYGRAFLAGSGYHIRYEYKDCVSATISFSISGYDPSARYVTYVSEGVFCGLLPLIDPKCRATFIDFATT